MKFIESANGFKLDKKVIEAQFELIYEYLRSFTYYRAIHKSLELKQLATDEQFWVHSVNCFLGSAIIQWCKIFGSNDNEVHWKKSSISNHNNFQKIIRNKILKNTGFSIDNWKVYQEKMRDFRNTYLAHRHTSNLKPVPFLNKSFEVTAAYFDFIVDELPWHGHQPHLKELKKVFELEVERILLNVIKF